MGLKRKRSSPAFASPTPSSTSSDATLSSSPLPSFYTQTKPVEPLYQKPTWSFPTYDEGNTSGHLNSRTRKRHRDDRPGEEVVFENTMNRLYQAQRQHPHASPQTSNTVQIQAQPQPQPQRSTLHSFWRIPQQPPACIPMVIDHGQMDTSMRCEDCDGALRHDEAMEIDEDMFAEETGCFVCKRRVCDTCAVRGDRRVCLGCATGGGGM